MKKIIIISIILCLMFLVSCSKSTSSITTTNSNRTTENSFKEFTITIFSDVHYGTHNYNNFTCTEGLTKLGKIINETPKSKFYINLGDFIDNMNKSFTLLDEAISYLDTQDIAIFNNNYSSIEENKRIMYYTIGNHETNTIDKSSMSKYIPYIDGVGQVFYFKYEGVLFVAIDANYSYDTISDKMEDMYCTKFSMPQEEFDWFKDVIDKNLNDKVNELVILSHIPVKDIDQKVIWPYIDYVTENYPDHHITMFDGHIHTRQYNNETNDDNESTFTEYTLPAVTTTENYEYYNVTFKNGQVSNVEMVLNNAPLE